jgi:hypothetical protein
MLNAFSRDADTNTHTHVSRATRMTSLASPQKQHFATQKFANYKEEVEREREWSATFCARAWGAAAIYAVCSLANEPQGAQMMFH